MKSNVNNITKKGIQEKIYLLMIQKVFREEIHSYNIGSNKGLSTFQMLLLNLSEVESNLQMFHCGGFLLNLSIIVCVS